MDTLALNLTLGTVAAPAVTGAESVLPEATDGAGPIDFATLLAAGLDIAQTPALPVAVAPVQSETTAAHALDTTPEPLPDALAAVAQGIPQLALQAIATQAAGPAPGDRGTGAQGAIGHPADSPRQATPLAAAPAIIAGAPVASAASEGAGRATPTPFDQSGTVTSIETAHTAELTAELTNRAAEQLATSHNNLAAETTAAAFQLAPSVERPVAPHATALLEVGAPVSGPGFANALSRQIVWMVDKDAQVAELRINPPELGPVQVRLTLSGEEASAQFVSAHADVRNAIESAIGRLREAMAEAGIQLGEATVSAESFRDQDTARQGQGEARHGYRADPQASTPHWPAGSAHARIPRGLIDVFA